MVAWLVFRKFGVYKKEKKREAASQKMCVYRTTKKEADGRYSRMETQKLLSPVSVCSNGDLRCCLLLVGLGWCIAVEVEVEVEVDGQGRSSIRPGHGSAAWSSCLEKGERERLRVLEGGKLGFDVAVASVAGVGGPGAQGFVRGSGGTVIRHRHCEGGVILRFVTVKGVVWGIDWPSMDLCGVVTCFPWHRTR
jgi:hypothetical protein